MSEGQAEMRDEIRRHDKHQTETKKMARSVVNMFFVLSGGALATCATFFSDKPDMPAEIVHPTRLAWVALTVAILMFGVTLVSIIGRDYEIGEHWRNQIEKGESQDAWKHWDKFIWGFAILGFIGFATGLIGFGVAAWVYFGHGNPLSIPQLP